MTPALNKHNRHKKTGENPYRDLYIYYLQGRLDSKEQGFGNSFIGNWEEDEFTFLFFSKPSDETINKMTVLQPQMKLLDQFRMTYEQWHGNAVEAMRMGNFIIEPPWDPGKDCFCNQPKMHRILLDPGVVFGTGTHSTTRDCLTAMEIAFGEEIPESCIDMGTGTGILALAAAKLGCCRTLAVDLNLLSVKTTRQNILLNGLEDKILAIQGSAENFMDYPVDFMIANIHYDIMKNIVNSPGFYKKKRFILSGLMRSEARAVKDCLTQHHAQIIQTWDMDGIWFTFLGKTIS